MNEKLSLSATAIEQQQQLQLQQQQQLPFVAAPSTLLHGEDYHYTGATATAATSYALELDQTHISIINTGTPASCEFGDGLNVSSHTPPTATNNTSSTSSNLLRYASVASLGVGGAGGAGGGGGTTPLMHGLDGFMGGGGIGSSTAIAPQVPTTGILKSNSSNNSNKGSNMNSPHKPSESSMQGGSFCGCCFGRGTRGDKSQPPLPALTFWPALLANLGICTLLLGYLLIGSFLFLTIETSGDGGRRGGDDGIMDASAWHYAQQNAYISTQQHEQQQQQHEYEQAKLYKTNHEQLVAEMAAAAAAADKVGAAGGMLPQNNNDRLPRTPAALTAANGTTALPFGVIAQPEAETSHIGSRRHRNSNDATFGINGGNSAAGTEYQTMSLAEATDGAAESGDHAQDGALQRTVENIWDITVSLNILYKENWTKLAALEINKFQDQLVKRLVMDLTLSTATAAAASSTANDEHYRQQQQLQRERYWLAARQRQLYQQQQRMQQQKQQFEWNFATAFLYSLTVVTTVGYGTITPRTTLGRMVTIFYATLGIPLTLVYLSSIGSILAKLAGGLCARLLCSRCCSCTATSGVGDKRHTFCGGFGRQQQVSDKKCNLKLKQLQQHQQQQPQQQTAAAAQTQPHTTALPYCYVRPPAELDATASSAFDTLSYPPSGSESLHSHQHSSPMLRWSLALPVGLCVLLLLAYVAFGSLVIALLERWSLFDGIYFCFMSLTTIGFCDLLPGVRYTATTSSSSTVIVWFCAVYILSGLTLTSMCINMLHEEFLLRMRVVVKFKKIAAANDKIKERNFFGAPP